VFKDNLENQFHREMVNTYEQARRDLHYTATYFIQMVAEVGGVQAAHKLLATPDTSSGFAVLWKEHRLDLSVEALALLPKYQSLFTEAEREIAHQRLEAAGYFK
jgi:hypothetical protein